MQLAGRFWAEAALLKVARSFERATDWHSRVPPPL
jgi:Asp-tRNA(Asn)/Glu-tRNA(Gln) amidotransferase A subunit family amidase